MSIIYDALKKSQKTRAAQPRLRALKFKLKLKKFDRRNTIISMLILTCAAIIFATLTVPTPTSVSRLFSQTSTPPLPTVIKTRLASAPRLMLEGVFLSENERLAMINHRTYHEGDLVNGMQVVNIALDQVTLQGKTRSMVLRNSIPELN